jgi:hypothetical protein
VVGAGAAARPLAGTVSWLGEIAAGGVKGGTLDAPAYDGIARSSLRVRALQRVATDERLRHDQGIATAPEQVWSDAVADLERIAALDPADAGDAEDSLRTLHHIESIVRDAGGGAYLDSILERPASADLTGRHGGD